MAAFVYYAPTIGGKNLYTEWHLVPTVRPHIAVPEVKRITIEVPGRNGVLDYTDYFGGPYYGLSTGEWTFIFLQDINPETGMPFTDEAGSKTTMQRLTELENHLHGKYLPCRLSGVADFNTYHGRFEITNFESGKDYSNVTISYEIDDYFPRSNP